ncbi:MAG: LysE family translocator [Sphingobacteriales bacterium]|nr:MAG: LysE family translocator [Sphingobacteriales bacterium]
MIEAILLGICAGVIFSFLTGPVFFSMVKTSIEKGFKAGFALAIGVVLSDMIFISLTLFSSRLVYINTSYNNYIGLVGGIFLLGIGFYYLLKKVRVNYELGDEIKVRKRGYILKGFLMCILSPTTYMFWIVLGGIVSVQLHLEFGEKVMFFITAMATQFAVDTLKTYYAAKLRYRIKESTIQLLNRIAGAVIIIFALRLFLQVILKS